MKKNSIIFCTVFVLAFLGLLVVLLVMLPWFLETYGHNFGMLKDCKVPFLITFYICAPAALTALFCLLALLRDIRRDQPFSGHTGKLLGWISWCCVEVAAATLVGSFWYVPFVVIVVCALFLFLLVRVVRLCFMAAKELKDENSLTI